MSSIDYATPAVASAVPPRRPIVELLALALPTMLQMLAYTVEQFLDTYMLARVSDLHAAAAGNAAGLVFAVVSFGFGVLMLVNALVSQNYGAGRFRECGPYLWQGVWIGLAYSVLVIPLMFAAHGAFRVMGHGPDLIGLEVQYFNVSVSMLAVKMVAIALGQFMVAINRPTVVFWAAATGVLANVGVNWLLIYGNWGLPKLGVAGAAWGTNAAVLTELLIVAGVALSPTIRARFDSARWRFDLVRTRELIRAGIPSGFQMAGDVFAWNIFFGAVLAAYGTAALAASIYAIQFMKLAFMPAHGLGTAVTALVARHVGEGRPALSVARAHLGFKVAAAYMLGCGLVFWLAGGPLMRMFTHDAEIISVGTRVLIFCALFQLFDAMFIVYSGALRGVRDTFVPACFQITLCWTMVVGGGLYVATYQRGWGVGGPWTIGVVYVAILGAFLFWRFQQKRWLNSAAMHRGFEVVPAAPS